MRQRPIPKLQLLDSRHPGLHEKVLAMFDEFWPTRDVRQILQAHYGERVSLSCLEKCKTQHRKEQRQLASSMIALDVNCSVDLRSTTAVGDRRYSRTHQHLCPSV